MSTQRAKKGSNSVYHVVGVTGFEPAASWSRSQRSTRPGNSITPQTVARDQKDAVRSVQESRPGPVNTMNFVTHLLPGGRGARLYGATAPLMSVADVSAWLTVSTATVYRLCASGRLPHCRVSNAIRIAPASVVAYVESCGGPLGSTRPGRAR